MDLTRNINGIINPAIQKALIAVGIPFLILCITFYFIFLPALRQSHSLSKQIKNKKTDLTKLQTLPGDYELSESQVNKIKNQLEIIKDRLFWEKDISKFLNELTQLASDLPIEFVSLKPESVSLPTAKDKKELKDYPLTQVPISVTIRSSYDGLVNFLKRIEEADEFIEIDFLNIESERSDIFKHNVKIRLNIFTKES